MTDAPSTDAAWEAWAVQDPFFSVLTDPKFRAGQITDQARAEFFASGRAHVDHVLAICRERLFPGFAPQRVLDFGCGVGRLLIPFAAIAREAVGVDVSPTMLDQTRRHCAERQITNVVLALSDDSLSQVVGDFDLVHTCIVLQHVSIARGRLLFAELARRVRPGGCGALHVTFAWDRHAAHFGQTPPPAPVPVNTSVRAAIRQRVKETLRAWFPAPPAVAEPRSTSPDPEMQMNFYNLSELMFILQQMGIERVHTELTDHGGALGAFLFFRRPV